MFPSLVHMCLLSLVLGRLIPEKKCYVAGNEECNEECKDSSAADDRSCKDDHEDPESCHNWRYPSTNWPVICYNYCDRNMQSPIDIKLGKPFFKIEKLIYTNYKPSISTVTIKNNGHSATVSWDTSINTPRISGGGLTCEYSLAGFHYHWGCENTHGSEHTVDGQRFAMEMHLVHYKTSYGSIGEAIKHTDGLAVLGVLFTVGAENQALKPITDNLSKITEPGEDTEITFNVALADFLPSNNQTFFRYQGSLTTPTCNEVVVWTVFHNHVELSQAQIDAFRSMKDIHHNSMCNNYREVQPINGRNIASYNVISSEEDAQPIYLS